MKSLPPLSNNDDIMKFIYIAADHGKGKHFFNIVNI